MIERKVLLRTQIHHRIEICGEKRKLCIKYFIVVLDKTTKSWFYKLKLQIIITIKDELINISLPQAE